MWLFGYKQNNCFFFSFSLSNAFCFTAEGKDEGILEMTVRVIFSTVNLRWELANMGVHRTYQKVSMQVYQEEIEEATAREGRTHCIRLCCDRAIHFSGLAWQAVRNGIDWHSGNLRWQPRGIHAVEIYKSFRRPKYCSDTQQYTADDHWQSQVGSSS